MKISENMLICLEGGRIVRVLFVNNFTAIIYVVDMDSNKWPYPMRKEMLEKGSTVLKEDETCMAVTEEGLNREEIERRDRAFEIVIFIEKELEGEKLFLGKYRHETVKTAAETFNVGYNTVKNYLMRYWKGGQVKGALVSNFYRCGAKGEERTAKMSKRGRPRIGNKGGGVNVDDCIQRIFKTGLNKHYYNERQNSLKTAYELTIKDFFTKEKTTQSGMDVSLIEDIQNIPTYEQFLYWFKKFNNTKTEISTRNGSRVYYQKHRAIIGDSTQDAGVGPGTLWQLDSTICDIYLVSSFNRDLIVGRPVLYIIIDVYSRMIVGMNVTFESFNSYIGAMVALANAMTAKAEYCSKYGIEISEGDWPVSCVPQKILADRGELIGGQIESAIENLGISVQNTPSYRADYKGIIEQSFRLVNLKFKPFVDGAVISGKNIIERGEKNYRLKANLTIEEFTRIIIKSVLFHNNHHVLSQYVLDEMMVEDAVEKIPVKIWNHGLESEKGRFRSLPEDFIRLSLFPTDVASVTSRGVAYKKMLYASSYALENGWFQTARNKGAWKVRISYDPRDLTDIYVIEDNGRSYHKLTLLEHLSKFERKDLTEIEEIFKYESEQESKSKEMELQKKIELFRDIEDIVKMAKSKTESEEDIRKSKSEKLKNISENKQEERTFQRDKLKSGGNEQVWGERGLSDEIKQSESDGLDLFKQMQLQAWGVEDE